MRVPHLPPSRDCMSGCYCYYDVTISLYKPQFCKAVLSSEELEGLNSSVLFLLTSARKDLPFSPSCGSQLLWLQNRSDTLFVPYLNLE